MRIFAAEFFGGAPTTGGGVFCSAMGAEGVYCSAMGAEGLFLGGPQERREDEARRAEGDGPKWVADVRPNDPQTLRAPHFPTPDTGLETPDSFGPSSGQTDFFWVDRWTPKNSPFFGAPKKPKKCTETGQPGLLRWAEVGWAWIFGADLIRIHEQSFPGPPSTHSKSDL